ncbi:MULTISPECIES: ROK family protein [Clostridia]|uniref:ROK family protein n=1 Tax=Clostridium sp. 1xD42-85 TaxID=2320084 RepID=UPI000EA2DB84|nr:MULTISPECIES: ROK family protein [Clostridia]NBJ68168.1 ROK family protein [Roseburia sp. 1XD42-34]RKI81941.1 ROK family protein [Clostridium sp. 1xD42-85]
MTVWTGISAGFVVRGEIFQGRTHPEMGDILMKQHSDDLFAGSCPSHGPCLEGLASGTAIEKRYMKADLLAEHNYIWEIETYYLAQALMNYYVILSPEKMILGGGVMKRVKLYTMIRKQFMKLLNDYMGR